MSLATRQIRQWSLSNRACSALALAGHHHAVVCGQPRRGLVFLARRLQPRDGYVALCPEYDIASQGNSIEEARANLREALELFFETASPDEAQTRRRSEVYVTMVEVAVG